MFYKEMVNDLNNPSRRPIFTLKKNQGYQDTNCKIAWFIGVNLRKIEQLTEPILMSGFGKTTFLRTIGTN